jgi:predicted metal-binding protein
MIKVLWRSSQIEEVTWEKGSEMRRKYLELLLNTSQELMIKGYIYKSMSLVLYYCYLCLRMMEYGGCVLIIEPSTT